MGRITEVNCDCSLHTTSSVAAIVLLRSRLPPRFPAELTALWIGLPDDRKWRKDVVEALLRAKLLHAPELDAHMSKFLQLNRSSAQPVEFAVHLVGCQPFTIWFGKSVKFCCFQWEERLPKVFRNPLPT